jgi:hypothetical protein
MALFSNLCVNLRDFWFGCTLKYASAQSLDLLDLAETGNPPQRGETESPQGTKKIPIHELETTVRLVTV